MSKLTVSRRYRWTAAMAGATLAASAVAAVPASGTIGPAGIRAGKNITVFHNIDFVAVFGYGPVGRRVTVDVIRDGVRIGTATGPTVSTPEGPALEVNHGPEGAPQPGDCWTGHTPDIQPGDLIRVRDGAGTDEVIVDDIRFTGTPTVEASTGDVLLEGVARRANGDAIPVGFLDSAEFRDGSRLRAEATEVLVQARAGEVGGFTVRYQWPFSFDRNRDLLSPQQIQQRLVNVEDGHAIGFGHTEVLPPEAMLIEGIADAPGPALGCEGSSPSGANGVGTVSPSRINASTPLDTSVRVRGFSQDATDVTVTLTDTDGTVVSATTTPAPATGAQTWAVTFASDQLTGLTGEIRVAASFTGATGDVAPAKSLLKDTVAPNSPTARPGGGTFTRTKRVALRAAAGDRIRYTLGDGSQAAPTARSGRRYTGTRIRIARTKTLKAVAIDRAGNVSSVLRQRYRIR